MPWLLAACGAAWLASIVLCSTFVPLRHPDGLEYVFVWPDASLLLTAGAAATLTIVSLFGLVDAGSRRRPPPARGAARGRWLAPLVLLALLPLGVLPAAPHVGEPGALLAYLFFDLRWWWVAVVTAWSVVNAAHELGWNVQRIEARMQAWRPASRRLLLETSVFGLVLAWTFVTTPGLRSRSGIGGDEPKYLRFCELWYQGGGLDVSTLGLVADRPRFEPPHLLRNVGHAVAVVPELVHDLAADLPAFVRHPLTFRWSRVTADNGFVNGKHGGVYQVHQPGVSVALLPGYVLDRYWLHAGADNEGRFPRELPWTSVAMWLWAGACGVALFRLLTAALHSEALAWAWALVGSCTFPAAAFAFQFYPELPALYIVLTATRRVLFPTAPTLWDEAVLGFAIGSLAWFHPRFLLVAALLTGLAVAWRQTRAAKLVIAGSAAVPVALLMTFAYHVSGSFLPTALWEANEQSISLLRMGFVLNALGYGLDRTWGAFPHALVLILAIPGLAVLGRTSRREALVVAGLVLALLVPAAGHALSAAGTTPARLIVAVVPLLIWPAAVFVTRWWSHIPVRAASLGAIALSFEAAATYNHWNTRGRLVAESASGWRPNLAFPIVRGDVWNDIGGNAMVFGVLLIALALSAAIAWRAARSRAREGTLVRHPRAAPLTTLTAAIGAGWLATAANGDWTSEIYLIPGRTAITSAAGALLDHPRCRVCFSTRSAQMDWKRVRPNPATDARADWRTQGLDLDIDVIVEGGDDAPAFGRARIEFGDGTASAWTGVMNRQGIHHRYAVPGDYRVVLSFESASGSITAHVYTVKTTRDGGLTRS